MSTEGKKEGQEKEGGGGEEEEMDKQGHFVNVLDR